VLTNASCPRIHAAGDAFWQGDALWTMDECFSRFADAKCAERLCVMIAAPEVMIFKKTPLTGFILSV